MFCVCQPYQQPRKRRHHPDISFHVFLFCLVLSWWYFYRQLSIGFGIVNKAEVDVCLELSHFFDDPTDAGNLISGSSAFSESSLNIWKFMVHLLLDPGMENFEHYFASV